MLFRSLLVMMGLLGQQPSASSSSAALDFEFFRTRVQPVFMAKRPGHARCIACHISGTPMRLQPLAPGSTMWSEEESRKNFDVVRQRVMLGNSSSRLLVHVLATEAGGDFFHNGGKHWQSQNDPDRKSTRLNSSHIQKSRMPSSA